MVLSSFRRGVRASLGVNAVVAGFGILYGVGAVQAGLPPLLAIASSLVILSGAAQFTAVALIGAGAGPFAVIVAVTGLGLRHLPMGAAIGRLVPDVPRAKRLALAYVLTDETFGLTMRAARDGEPHPEDFMLGANLTLVTGWVLGTVAGVGFGDILDVEALGAGALFALLFLGLARESMTGRRDVYTAVAAAGAAVVSIFVIPAAWRITVAGLATAAAVASLPPPRALHRAPQPGREDLA